MTANIAQHSTGLDFEVTATTHANHFDFVVFEPATGREIQVGGATTRERATQAAVRFIAKATPHRLFVLRNRTGWIMWHRDSEAWMPLPLTAEADMEAARAFAANLPLANGRPVIVVLG